MTRRTRIFVGGIALLVCIVGGAAFAYFTSGGNGSGTANANALQPVTVVALVGGDTPASALQPGASAEVILRVNNPNAFVVKLVTVTGGPGAITADAGHATCTSTGVTFNNQTGMNVSIGATGTTLVRISGGASMGSGSLSSCQGATFTIPVTTTVQK